MSTTTTSRHFFSARRPGHFFSLLALSPLIFRLDRSKEWATAGRTPRTRDIEGPTAQLEATSSAQLEATSHRT